MAMKMVEVVVKKEVVVAMVMAKAAMVRCRW